MILDGQIQSALIYLFLLISPLNSQNVFFSIQSPVLEVQINFISNTTNEKGNDNSNKLVKKEHKDRTNENLLRQTNEMQIALLNF